nr:helix-turn-helix domain-containing protein [Thermoanaerobacterium sp. RBIITD]
MAIAKEMLSEGISIEKIAKITKLSAEEIKKLIH